MEEISFRTRSEPQPISTREDIAQLNAALRMSDVRRLERSKEREDKRQLVRLRTKEKLEKVLALEMQALKTPTNKSGEPYIGRYRNSKGEGYHWHVSIIRKGVRHRKSFSDSVYGGKDKALLAAKSWRDEIFLSAPWGNMATSVARIKANNTSGVAGVTLTRHERGGKTLNIGLRPALRNAANQIKARNIHWPSTGTWRLFRWQ